MVGEGWEVVEDEEGDVVVGWKVMVKWSRKGGNGRVVVECMNRSYGECQIFCRRSKIIVRISKWGKTVRIIINKSIISVILYEIKAIIRVIVWSRGVNMMGLSRR